MGTLPVPPRCLRKGHGWIRKPSFDPYLQDEPRHGGHPNRKPSPHGQEAVKCTFGVSARLSASVGLNCKEKHFRSPSWPGSITWPKGLPEHRGQQAPTQPQLQGIHCLRWEAFRGKRLVWKIPSGFPREMQRGPRSPGTAPSRRRRGTHFVEAVDWMPPLEVRVQYFPV